MNNKGFTLVEVMAMLVIISIALFVIVRQVGSTLSITKKESYEVMKDNIISASEDYITECNNNIISCDLDWNNDKFSFKAILLKESGYFNNLDSPIDGKDLSNCLIINASRNNGVIDIDLVDTCY